MDGLLLFPPAPSNNIKKNRPTYHKDVIILFLQSPVTSLRPDTCPCFILKYRQIVSLTWSKRPSLHTRTHPYKSTGDITLLYISEYLWLGKKKL
jgi:hypothetical protein